MNKNRPYLIAGIDPGTTAGIAVLDFEGNPISLLSSRDMSLDRVIKHLIELGKVSLIAVDVKPAPGFVPKLATLLGSEVFVPEEPLSVSEKIEITREHKTENSHQRDALAAAFTAFNRFRNKFAKIDSLELGEEVKHLFLHGISINDAVSMLESEEDEETREPEEEKPASVPSPEEIRIRQLERQNSTLRDEIREREKEISGMRDEIARVKKSYNVELRKDKEIEKRESAIRGLKGTITELREKYREMETLGQKVNELSKGEIRPVAVFPEVYDGLSFFKRKPRKDEISLLEGIEIAFVEKPEIEKKLNDMGFSTHGTEFLEEVAGFLYISSKNLEESRKSRNLPLKEIVETYRKER